MLYAILQAFHKAWHCNIIFVVPGLIECVLCMYCMHIPISVGVHVGLVKIATDLGLLLLPPRKKIIVMIMGNHSAGKSSFINW